ncbi:hypothetical protein Bca52824_081123 [Brassica carinata]|uniref:F-box domain-containing protein n=1 Tax=Brassica carinata TaxID=52824 RepID=A0A8X7PHD8_BRACI|nr:hypothetical protein Bca52824_081123 [Brassica carinata]
MEEILARLPAKSLMRFKCVSKVWSSLISSRYFSNRFLTVPTRPRPRIYMCLQDNNDYSHSVTLSLAPDTTNPNRFVVDHNLTSPRVGGYVLQNLCGFMCYSFINKPRIYNPATRQLVTLPAPIKSQTEEDAYGYYFGYDPVIDQYNCNGLGPMNLIKYFTPNLFVQKLLLKLKLSYIKPNSTKLKCRIKT